MRRLFLPVLLFVLFTVFSARAGQPSYSADVTVDVTADNASAARELAMRRANRQAVSAIAANFTTREGVTVLNKLTDDQLLNFIRETTVLEEKTSNVRYLAKLRITANDKILRQYLQEKNVPLVVASSAESWSSPFSAKVRTCRLCCGKRKVPGAPPGSRIRRPSARSGSLCRRKTRRHF